MTGHRNRPKRPKAADFFHLYDEGGQPSQQATSYDGYRPPERQEQPGEASTGSYDGYRSEWQGPLGEASSGDGTNLLWTQTGQELATLQETQPDEQEESKLTAKQVVDMIASTKRDTEDARKLGREYKNMVSEQELENVIQKMEDYMSVARKNIHIARKNLSPDNSVSMENSLKELIIISRIAIEAGKTTKWLINKDIESNEQNRR